MNALHAVEHEIDAHLAQTEREESAAERADTLRAAILADRSFIVEAIGNGDLTELADAYKEGGWADTYDALADVVASYLQFKVTSELRRDDRFSSDYPRTDLAALENIARAWGVRA